MGNKKKYRTLKIEDKIYYDLKDFKRRFEYENSLDVTFSELVWALIHNAPVELKNLPSLRNK